MTQRDRPSRRQGGAPEPLRETPEHVWRTLLAAAQASPVELPGALPGDLADRVLAQRSQLKVAVRVAEERRLVSYAAAFALAASLMFMISSWGALVEVVAPRPALFDDLIAWEPLP